MGGSSLYKLKNGGDKNDKNIVHLRKKSIKEEMVKHSFSGCEVESAKYSRKKASNYKSFNSNNNSSGSNSKYYCTNIAKYNRPAVVVPSKYNEPKNPINTQYQQ